MAVGRILLLSALFLLATSLLLVSAGQADNSCAGRCFASYNASYPCQCSSDCLSYGDCCADFNTYCTTGNYSCQDRCGIYESGKPCQCDPTCSQYGNCCPDFVQQCSTALNMTCAGRCGNYDSTAPCQCNSGCDSYGDCCPDYDQFCAATGCDGRCGFPYDGSAACQCNSECVLFGTCCPDAAQYCGFDVTDAELQQLSQTLWVADADHLTVTLDLQQQTIDGSGTDNAPEPLCSGIPPEIYTRPMYTTLQALYDNYQADESVAEDITPDDDTEIDNFLDQVVQSLPMTYTFTFLVSKGIVANDTAQFQQLLKTIWFGLYLRQDVLSSSGAEDVLIGEVESIPASVDGLYNWVRFCTLEAAQQINYLGYVKSQDFGTSSLVRFPYYWNSNFKAVGDILFGSGPGFDISVYTLCFFTRPNALCNLMVNGLPLTIQSYVVNYQGTAYLLTAYPAY